MLIDLFKKRPYSDSIEDDEETTEEINDDEMRDYNFNYNSFKTQNSIQAHISKKSSKNNANKR